MHIVFVHAALPGTPFNSSIAALSGALKAVGHKISLLVMGPTDPLERLEDTLRASAPDVVAFSYMTVCAAWNQRLIAQARRALPGIPLIAGGAHPTTHPHTTLADTELDAVCVGEGELPLVRWLEDRSRPNPGILRKGHSDPLQRWWADDVDALPDWDLELFGSRANQGNRYERAVPIAFARGFCPHTCTFCGVDGYRRTNQQPARGAMRLRSPERCVQEILRYLENNDAPIGFAAWDAILPTKRAWVERFFRLYGEQVGLPMAVHARVEQIQAWTIDAMREGGCDYVVLGIECGDQAYRKRILGKYFRNQDAIHAVTRLEDAGITTFCSFMVGLPLETPKMLAATVRLARSLPTSILSWKFYVPESGTRLFRLLEDYDLVIPRYVDAVFDATEPTIKLTRCTQADVDKAVRALNLLKNEKSGASKAV